MVNSVVTLLDDNIAIERQRIVNILQDTNIKRIVSNKTIHLYCTDPSTNNNETAQFSRQFSQNKSALLRPTVSGSYAVTAENLAFDDNAQLLCMFQNIYISSFNVQTLYGNAWSNTLEIYMQYDGTEIILSSQVISLLDFKLARHDLFYANRYFANYLNCKILDIKAMMTSNNIDHRNIIARLLNINVNSIQDNLLSPIMYRLSYIDSDNIEILPVSEFFTFSLNEILTKTENPAAYTLQGDLNILVSINENALLIEFDETNVDLMNTLNQIANSVEQLQIEHTVTTTSYKATVDLATFEYNGVQYTEIAKDAITVSNALEPAESIQFRPIVSSDADLVYVDIDTTITSSNNTIALSKQSNAIFVDNDLNRLKTIVYAINANEYKISNVINTTKNVVQFNNAIKSNTLAQQQSLQFVILKAINVNFEEQDFSYSDDNTTISLPLRNTALTYALQFVTDSDIDLRNYDSIKVIYAGKSNKPIKVDKDTIFFKLAWQNADEIAIEINGSIATVVGATKT